MGTRWSISYADIKIIAWVVVLGSIAILCVMLIFALYIFLQERAKVLNAQQVPIDMCDKHGLYPASESILTDIPVEGGKDLVNRLCPFCLSERLQNASVKNA